MWLVVVALDSGNGWLIFSLFFASLVSLVIIILTKVESTVLLQKLGLFVGTNIIGLIVLLSNLDFGFEEEAREVDQFMFFFYLQLFMIIVVFIVLFIRKVNLKKRVEKLP
ncbi:MAG: hypothetical protein GPJ54_19600 [Candidatus Heimdallarchaeota archaeon]|nr:hypothetical protein [Candidatus Heimdallarchaeota archaeon]